MTGVPDRQVGRVPGGQGARALLFDAEGDDREVPLDGSATDLEPDQLLWVDLDLEHRSIDTLADRFGLERSMVRSIESPEEAPGDPSLPAIRDFDDYFHLNVSTVAETDVAEPRFERLDLVVGKDWIVTAHRGPSDLMDSFLEPIHGDTKLGRLTGPLLLAVLLDRCLNGYLAAAEKAENEVDAIDEAVIRGSGTDAEDLTEGLVRLRRRTRALRRALTSHREVLSILAQPEFDQLSETDSAVRFQDLSARLERAIDAVEAVRDMVVGSFELVMTRTAQRTNEVMKVLTVISAVLLPATLLAGILGMNFHPPFFDHPDLFWVALGAMALLAACILAFAKARRWY